MDDAALVRVVDRPADRGEEAQPVAQLRRARARRRRGARARHASSGLAADQLHREEVLAVVRAAGLVERGDVRMHEARERLRLAAEQAQVLIVDEAAAADDLERDAAVRVLCSAS